MTTIAVDRPPAPALTRLTAVEVRKMTGTRSGRWMLIIAGLIGIAMIGVVLFAVRPGEQTLVEMFVASTTGVSVLLPILGILLATGEWSQRTALTTFALVPERRRVAVAKLLAGAALAAASIGVCLVLALAGRGTGQVLGRSEGSLRLPPSLFGTVLLGAVIGVLAGVAFGMLFMNTPLAIVLFFLIPAVWTMLGESVSALDTAADWLDQSRTFGPLSEEGMTAKEWARLATSAGLWLGLPIIAGMLRLARREVK